MDYDERRAQIKAEMPVIDADLEQRWQRVWRAYSKSSKESEKLKCYAHEQCDLLRALEDLAATERTMYELDAPFGSGDDRLEAGSSEFGHVDT